MMLCEDWGHYTLYTGQGFAKLPHDCHTIVVAVALDQWFPNMLLKLQDTTLQFDNALLDK